MTSASQARPLKWTDSQSLRVIADRINTASRRWIEQWVDAGDAEDYDDTRVTVTQAFEADAARPQSLCMTDSIPLLRNAEDRDQVWLAFDSPDDTSLLAALFGESRSAVHVSAGDSPVARRVAHSARIDLVSSLTSELFSPASDIDHDAIKAQLLSKHGDRPTKTDCAPVGPTHFYRKWSGAVHVALQIGQVNIVLLIGPGRARKLAPPREPGTAGQRGSLRTNKTRLTPLADAIVDRTTTLSVTLDPVEISLGALSRIKVGDVVGLGHALDQALTLRSFEGAPLCSAYLGKRDGRLALALAPL